MGIIPSRNLDDQRREKDGIVYFDRGTLTGKNGRRYDRFAIQTHFVEVGEDQAELVRRYVLPLAQDGDVLSFGAKVMAMCTRNVKTKEEVHPGFWARKLAPFAGINETGVGMHEPYKLQLVIDMCGLPRVLFAAVVSAKELALINPPNPVELCNKLEKDTGIPVVLMDANDIDQNQLGKCEDFPLTDEEIQDAMADNPSGQGDELTPLILIRPLS